MFKHFFCLEMWSELNHILTLCTVIITMVSTRPNAKGFRYTFIYAFVVGTILGVRDVSKSMVMSVFSMGITWIKFQDTLPLPERAKRS